MSATLDSIEFMPLERDFGELWQTAELESGRLILTSAGVELRTRCPEIEGKYVPEYIDALLESDGSVYGSPHIEDELDEDEMHRRAYIARGGTSEVFTFAPDVAVKEVVKKSGSAHTTLDVMDRLARVVKDLPDWIAVPDHYGAYIPASGRDDFIAIQQIDSGINADWIIDSLYWTGRQAEIVEREFGRVEENEANHIQNACEEAQDLVVAALKDADLDINRYLTDYDFQNVLVERLEKPIDGKQHKLWIIDQQPALDL